MKLYELTYLLSPNTGEDEASTTLLNLRNFISDNQGEIKAEIQPMPIKLDYPVNGFKTAFMASFDLNLAPEKIMSLVKFIELQKAIINHIIFQKRISTHAPRMARPIPAEPVSKEEAIIEKAKEEIAEVEDSSPAQIEEEIKPKIKKVELESLDQKLDEILGEE